MRALSYATSSIVAACVLFSLSIVQGGWQRFLGGALGQEEIKEIRSHERTGRPLGSSPFVAGLERKLGRTLTPQKPGRKPKKK